MNAETEGELNDRIWAYIELGYVYGWNNKQKPVWCCPHCAAAVADRFFHDGWHQSHDPASKET